jgi:hypothetical protein
MIPEGAIVPPEDYTDGTGRDAGNQDVHVQRFVEAEARVAGAKAALAMRGPGAYAPPVAHVVPTEQPTPNAVIALRADQLPAGVDDRDVKPENVFLADRAAMTGPDDDEDDEPEDEVDATPAPMPPPQIAAPKPAPAPAPVPQPQPQVKKMSTPATQSVVQGPPMDALRDLAQSYPRVAVKVQRYAGQQGGQVQLATLYSRAIFSPRELPDIEAWLERMSGGGGYVITVTDPDDPFRAINCPPFAVRVEGNVRAPAPLDDEHRDPNAQQHPPEYDARADRFAQGGGYGGSGAPRQVYNGAPVPAQYPGARGYGERPAPGATMASDSVLARELHEMKARQAQLELENKQIREDAARKERAAEKQLADERTRAQEERHRADMQRMSDKIDAALASKAAPQDTSSTNIELLKIMAPLVLAWLKDSSGGQQRLMEAMLLKGKDADPFADLARIEPLITKLAGGRGTKDESALLAKMNEGQIQNVMLMAEMVKSFADEKLPEDSPAMKMVQQVVASAATVGEAWFKQKAEEAEREAQEKARIAEADRRRALEAEAASRRARELASQPREQPSPPAVQPAQQQQMQAPTPGLDPTLAMQFRMLPPAFQTPEWQKLLTEMHLEKPDGKPLHTADEIGNYVAHYLEHLVMFGALPQELAGLLTEPRKTIDMVFGLMPLARKHPAHAKQIGDVVAAAFAQHAAENTNAQAAAAPASTTIVTPAPVNGAAVEASDEDDDEEEVRYPQ